MPFFPAYSYHQDWLRFPPRVLTPDRPSQASTLPTSTRRRTINVRGKDILVGWSYPADFNTLSAHDRRGIEELVAQAGAKFDETAVHIDFGLMKTGGEVNLRRNEYDIVAYDEHVVVSFPQMNRKAHVYIVKEGGDYRFRPLEKNRRIDKRPSVVLIY